MLSFRHKLTVCHCTVPRWVFAIHAVHKPTMPRWVFAIHTAHKPEMTRWVFAIHTVHKPTMYSCRRSDVGTILFDYALDLCSSVIICRKESLVPSSEHRSVQATRTAPSVALRSAKSSPLGMDRLQSPSDVCCFSHGRRYRSMVLVVRWAPSSCH